MIITLTGENDVLRQKALKQIAAEYDDMAIERLDGEDVSYERMHEAAQSLPFLVDKKLVILRTPSANKEFTEQFEKLVGDIPDTNDVVLVEPRPDKRLSYYKQLQKYTDFREFALLDSNGLATWLTNYAKEQGGSLGANDARILIDRAGLNQLTLQHEVDKLLAYDPKITRANVELLTERTPHGNAFAMLDAALTGNTKKAIELYDEQRAGQVEWQVIFGAMVWQLHLLAIVKAAGQKTAGAVAKEAKLNPYAVEKAQNLVRSISLEKLRALITALREFDVRFKTESLDADETLRYYLLKLAN